MHQKLDQKLDALLWWWPSLFSLHVAVAAVALLAYVLTTHSLRLYRQPSAAIAWIGESFYFVALDRGLRRPKLPLPTRQVSTGSAIPA